MFQTDEEGYLLHHYEMPRGVTMIRVGNDNGLFSSHLGPSLISSLCLLGVFCFFPCLSF